MVSVIDQPRSNILIVDDTPANLRVLNDLLTEAGFDVRPAPNGKLALSGAKAIPPDLILLDIKMPEMNGYEVCRELKQDRRTADIPVIFVSAYGNVNDVVKGFKVGGVDYITKPFHREEVLSRVNAQLILKAAIAEKEAANSRLEAIFSSVQDTIITLNSDLEIIHTNKNIEEANQLFQGEISNQDHVSMNNQRACYDIAQQVLESQHPVKEYKLEYSASINSKRSLVLNAYPLKKEKDSEAESSGVVLVIRDESRLQSLEKALNERSQFKNIIGKSKQVQKIFTLLQQMSDMEFNALIIGESGTGKELVAESIHYGGRRRKQKLVKVNCAALSDSLLESELFGHVRGAFTGAVSDRKGLIEAAESGTIFLDEIGDISTSMQLRLLRFLESKEYDRVGESKTRYADVRVIAATNSQLQEKIRKGAFREDLYYRLTGVIFAIPPLRERMEDLLLICDHFIQLFMETYKKEINGISERVKRRLMSHTWPGNIRELRNTIDFACALCPGGMLLEEHLPPSLYENEQPPKLRNTTIPYDHDEESEEQRILNALKRTSWNKAKAARILGISRATIYNKMKAYNIQETHK